MLLDILEMIVFVDWGFQIFFRSFTTAKRLAEHHSISDKPDSFQGSSVVKKFTLICRFTPCNEVVSHKPFQLESANLLAKVRHLNELLHILSC